LSGVIAVIGSGGQLARALRVRLARVGRGALFFGRRACDLSQDRALLENFAANMPQASGIIVAAAYTAVDEAESDADTARQVNTVAPEVFAIEAARRGIPLVHVSTDYVFGGNGSTPLKPDAPTNPINVYGRTKRDGENAILATGVRAAILRTSWVFDGTGKNFMTTIIRLGQTRDSLAVINDQIGRPTYAGHLAGACLAALKGLQTQNDFDSRIYHFSGSGDAVSWADFAHVILEVASGDLPQPVAVTGIPGSEYKTLAKRPNWSVMDINLFETTFSCRAPHWRDGLAAAYAEWQNAQKKAQT